MRSNTYTFILAITIVTIFLGCVTGEAYAASSGCPTPGRGDDGGGGGRLTAEEKLYELSDKIARLTQIFIYLIGTFFVARMLLIIFSSQIDLVGGKPGAIADMASEMVFALISFLLAVDTPKLARAFASIALGNVGAATSSDISNLGTVFEPIAGFVIGLLSTLVFVGFVVNFVFSGVQAVASSAIGNPGGMTNAISKAVSLVFTLLLGFAFLRTGQWIFQNLFHI